LITILLVTLALTLPDPDVEPTIGFRRALELVGVGATAGYAALKADPDRLPFPLIRVGRVVRVPTRSVLRLLDAEGGGEAEAQLS
jgi:hypothetical protein